MAAMPPDKPLQLKLLVELEQSADAWVLRRQVRKRDWLGVEGTGEQACRALKGSVSVAGVLLLHNSDLAM